MEGKRINKAWCTLGEDGRVQLGRHGSLYAVEIRDDGGSTLKFLVPPEDLDTVAAGSCFQESTPAGSLMMRGGNGMVWVVYDSRETGKSGSCLIHQEEFDAQISRLRAQML